MKIDQCLLMLLIALSAAATCCLGAYQNVTELLAKHPDYSTFNNLLSKYGVAAQINSRTTLTVFCPPNSATDPFLAAQGPTPDRQTMFNILSFHVILDYQDPAKLRALGPAPSTFTTLFQTTGLATGNNGFLNITYNRTTGSAGIRLPAGRGVVPIGDSLELFPYNISLLACGGVLVPGGLTDAPPPAAINVTQAIAQAGNFSRFVGLLVSSGVAAAYQARDAPPGLTVLAPTDSAFEKLTRGQAAQLESLSSDHVASLLKLHALPSFYPADELGDTPGSQPTLASSDGAGFTLTISKAEGAVTVDAGGSKAKVVGTPYSNYPVIIFQLDSLLLPTEIFGAAPPSAPLSPSVSPTSPPSSTPSSPPSSVPSPSLSRSPAASPSLSPSPSPSRSPSASPSSSSSPSPAPAPALSLSPSPSPASAASPPSPPLFSGAGGPSFSPASSPLSPTSSSPSRLLSSAIPLSLLSVLAAAILI